MRFLDAVLPPDRRWVILDNDCRQSLPNFLPASVDHVITDPPYSRHVHGKSRAGARKAPLLDGNGELSRSAISRSVDFGFEHLAAPLRRFCASEFARLTKRWVIAFSDLESSWLWRLSFRASGLEHVRECIWVKEGCTPQFTGDRPAVACEAINVAHRKGRKVWNGGGKRGVYTVPVELDRYGHGRVERVHPTQKPLELMLDLVRDFTQPDDIVLDPFSGSGTTGVACLLLGRRFIGCEIDLKFAESSVERLRAVESSTTPAAMRSGQQALFPKGAA